MKKTMILITMLVVVSSVLLAQDCGRQGRMEQMGNKQIHPGMMRDNHQEMCADIFDELDLSDKQQDKINKIRTENRKQIIKLNSDLEILRIDKKEAMKNNNFAEAKKINGKISELHLQKNNAKVTTKEAVWNELTKEQQKKLQDTMKNHRPSKKLGKMRHK